MITASSIVALVALLFTLYWEFNPNDISSVIDGVYLGGNIFFLVISFLLTGSLNERSYLKEIEEIDALAEEN